MKKSFNLIMVLLGLAVVSCNPMDEIHDEIDSELDSQLAVGNIEYTLTEDDYEEVLELSYPNFSSVEEAKTMIPGFLAEQYPYYGAGSQALITFDIYSPKPDERSLIVYEVETEDYDAYEETERFNNFDDMDQIYTFLNDKFPDVENRTLVSLTYKFYDGSTNELNNGFLYVNDSWMFIPGITEDEYAAMGEGYPNFSSEEEAEEKLPVFLKEMYKYSKLEEGDIYPIMYKLYTSDDEDVDGDGSTDDNTTYSYVKYFIYTDGQFEVYDNTIAQTLQFGYEDGMWVPDNTIKYTLTSGDYSIIAEALSGNDEYSTAVASMERYTNFDRRPGASAYWSDEMVLEAMRAFLNEIDPNAEEGQKYVLTFDIYNGSNTTEDISLIKENGEWVRF